VNIDKKVSRLCILRGKKRVKKEEKKKKAQPTFPQFWVNKGESDV